MQLAWWLVEFSLSHGGQVKDGIQFVTNSNAANFASWAILENCSIKSFTRVFVKRKNREIIKECRTHNWKRPSNVTNLIPKQCHLFSSQSVWVLSINNNVNCSWLSNQIFLIFFTCSAWSTLTPTSNQPSLVFYSWFCLINSKMTTSNED